MFLLKSPELREGLVSSVDGATEKELETSLKIELHFSYLHLVETLFEFIFLELLMVTMKIYGNN